MTNKQIKQIKNKYRDELIVYGSFERTEARYTVNFICWYEWHINKYYWENFDKNMRMLDMPSVINKTEMKRRVKFLDKNNKNPKITWNLNN